MTRLSRDDYRVGSPELAQRLLGCTLVRMTEGGARLSGRIVETEAYCGPEDQAAHSRNGHRSPRNEVMYGEPGLAYVYFTYGMHHCMNVVCGGAGEPVAVLLRALEPVEGLGLMYEHRAGSKPRKHPLREHELCSGPARLCQALRIDRRQNGLDLVSDNALWIEPRLADPGPIENRPRIGIGSAGDWVSAPLRWYVRESAHVSRR